MDFSVFGAAFPASECCISMICVKGGVQFVIPAVFVLEPSSGNSFTAINKISQPMAVAFLAVCSLLLRPFRNDNRASVSA